MHGVLARPRKPGPFPALLNLPGADVRSCSGNISMAARGFMTLQLRVHGIALNQPQALYDDSVNFARRRKVPRLYFWGFNDKITPPTSLHAACNVITAARQLLLLLAPEQRHVAGAKRPHQRLAVAAGGLAAVTGRRRAPGCALRELCSAQPPRSPISRLHQPGPSPPP